MTRAVVDLIKNSENPIVIKEVPERLVPVLHALIGACGTDRAYQPVHPSAQYPKESPAEALNDLARRSEAQNKIDFVLLEQIFGKLRCHSCFSGTGSCLAEKMGVRAVVYQRSLFA